MSQRRRQKVLAADLFCGAGGFSTGLLTAAEETGWDVDLLAINHWDVAIATHSKNHPQVRHLCQSVQSCNPRALFPEGRIHLLMASPECMHHSRARGGRPVNDQSRATAWHILHWAEALYIDHLIIENVPEFVEWGPVGAEGRPLKRGKGKLFEEFVRSLRTLDYKVEWRVLNAADYGDPTTRKRLFIRAAKRGRKIRWPEPSHRPATENKSLFDEQPTWRAAREIIDWTVPGKSIFARPKPLSPNTIRRIESGLRKFSGLPFVISCANSSSNAAGVRAVDDPTQTITGRGHLAVIEPRLTPFLIGSGGPDGQKGPDSLDDPMRTLITRNHQVLVEPVLTPYVVSCGGPEAEPRSVEEPMRTVLTREGMGIVEPFLIPYNSERAGQEGRCLDVDEPLGTVTAANRFGLVDPYLLVMRNHQDSQSLDEPVPTLTAGGTHVGVCEPELLPLPAYLTAHYGGEDCRDLDNPIPTVTAQFEHFGLAEPFLMKYNGMGENVHSVDEPVNTITSKDRFGLIQPIVRAADGQLYLLDIRFRMLQPHELAKAMSFPEAYEFTGNRQEKVKQIGNAVAVNTARALCKAILAPAG